MQLHIVMQWFLIQEARASTTGINVQTTAVHPIPRYRTNVVRSNGYSLSIGYVVTFGLATNNSPNTTPSVYKNATASMITW